MKINNTNPLDYPIPIEDEWKYYRLKQKEDREFQASDWFNDISEKEAKQVIEQNLYTYKENIREALQQWREHLLRIGQLDADEDTRSFLSIWYQTIYIEVIETNVGRAIKLAHRYEKHLYLTNPQQFESDNPGWISPQTIEIAKETSLASLLSNDGHKVIKAGQNFKCLCPFHTEKTPSFSIKMPDNWYHCFGCNVSGDAIEYIKKTRNINFPNAVRYLTGGTQ